MKRKLKSKSRKSASARKRERSSSHLIRLCGHTRQRSANLGGEASITSSKSASD